MNDCHGCDEKWPLVTARCHRDPQTHELMLCKNQPTEPPAQCNCASCCVVRTAIAHGTLPANAWD